MIKIIEAVIILSLMVFSFFLGVKYSEQVKMRASWMFDVKSDEEVELPDLSKEGSNQSDFVVDENGDTIENKQDTNNLEAPNEANFNNANINDNVEEIKNSNAANFDMNNPQNLSAPSSKQLDSESKNKQ
jgi:hypothetical protein